MAGVKNPERQREGTRCGLSCSRDGGRASLGWSCASTCLVVSSGSLQTTRKGCGLFGPQGGCQDRMEIFKIILAPALRWPGYSQPESGRFTRIDSGESTCRKTTIRVAQEPNRNRKKPEPSEPVFPKPKPKGNRNAPEPFSRNRNRNRNRPFLLTCTETQKNPFAEELPIFSPETPCAKEGFRSGTLERFTRIRPSKFLNNDML